MAILMRGGPGGVFLLHLGNRLMWEGWEIISVILKDFLCLLDFISVDFKIIKRFEISN